MTDSETRAKILTLRAEGVPVFDIAEQLRLSDGAVYKIIRDAAEEVYAGSVDLVRQRRLEHDLRLEDLYRHVRARLDGLEGLDLKQYSNLLRAAVAILDRQARLLGLDTTTSRGASGSKADWIDGASTAELIGMAKQYNLPVPERFENG